MKKVGVELTPNSFEPRSRTALTSSRSFWSVKQASNFSCVKPASLDDLQQRVLGVLDARPLHLLLEQHVDHREIIVARRSAPA